MKDNLVNKSGDLVKDLVNDTISRKAAVSGISDLLMLELKGERLPTYNEVYRAIYDLPPAQRWIPCSTALPEHDGEYLVTIKAFTIDQAVYADIDIARYTGGKWRKGFPVTAWCELPKPWEGENA